MKRLLTLTAMLALACHQEKPAPPAAPAYPAAELAKYRSERVERLRRDDSWLTLVGLHWLKEGPNTFGSGEKNAIRMPAKAPATLGRLVLANGKVTLEPAGEGMTIGGKPVTGPTALVPDVEEGGPTVVDAGFIRFHVIKRSDKFGLRVKDRQSEALTTFKGLDYFPTDPKWRVEAHLERYNPPKQVPITNIVGQTSPSPSPGALVFTVDGKEYRLDPIVEEGSDELFIIFADQTSGRETYGGGRYLYAKMPGADGKVVVDFNKAYNPPCVFTPYATCPLPPLQNRLAVRVEAGEKSYAGKHA